MKLLSFLCVLFGIVSCIYMETCPTYEEMHPCNCREGSSGDIIVSCYEELLNQERLKFALNSFSGKEKVNLELQRIKLGVLPSNYFYGIFIKNLKFLECDLDSLSDDGRAGLLGLESTLEELSIISSFTEDMKPTKLQLSHLVNLKELTLSSNVITDLNDDWFQRGPASLEYLIISGNRIEKIGRNAFANLVSLKRLTLTGNRFGFIQRSMFPYSAMQLQALKLDDNALVGLPDDIFSSMPALSYISLRKNGISRLDQRVWYLIWGQLDVISLEGNPIHCDGHMNWVFELRRTSAIYGQCYSPREFKGTSLQDLIDNRGRYGKLPKNK